MILEQSASGMTEALFHELWESTAATRELMTYYKFAMMEIETKFRVLNEQFSLRHNRNPIKTVDKPVDSIPI